MPLDDCVTAYPKKGKQEVRKAKAMKTLLWYSLAVEAKWVVCFVERLPFLRRNTFYTILEKAISEDTKLSPRSI